jgi:DNA-binding SARP family transcriptional activator
MRALVVSYRVLGPLEIVVDGHVVPIDAGKQRTVLAALLLQPNRTVSFDELTEKLWDGDEPRNIRSTVQKYLMRLRRLLAAAGLAGDVIRTEPDGYRVVVTPGQLDLDHFAALSHEWERAVQAGDTAQGAALLTEALGLWSAVPPLANVPSVSLHRHEVAGLVERYLHALDRRIELDLDQGAHAELVAELADLTRRWPHRERFWAQRMRALYRSGRQGEALVVYREVTRLLAEDLGVDPGVELQAAHREILAAPSRPAGRRTTTTGRDGSRPVRQLPRRAVGFVGREADLAQIIDALDEAPVVVTGMAGAGKSALAVHAAHLVAPRFPDGQLYADLRGSATDGPSDVREVLERFLHALGAPPDAVPGDEDTQILVYRSMLACQRMLVVLDDAADAGQVRALLPGTPGCAVLVTGRNELSGLLVSPGARRIRLSMLPSTQAHTLLTGLLGARRADADHLATANLIDMCGGLPLALRIAAAYLLQHPDLDVADYVERLRREGPAALHLHGDELASLPAVLDRSHRLLSPGQRRLLEVLGRLPTARFTAPTVAEQAGTTEAAAASGLEALAAASLLEQAPEGRYQMHRLIRGYVMSRPAHSLTAVPATRSA